MNNLRIQAQNLVIALALASQGSTATAQPQNLVVSETDTTAPQKSANHSASFQPNRLPLNGKVSALQGGTQSGQTATIKRLKDSAFKGELGLRLQLQQAKSQDVNEDININESQLSTGTGIGDKVNQQNGDNNQHGRNEIGGVNEPNGNNNQSGNNN